jgi:hypothetical protein
MNKRQAGANRKNKKTSLQRNELPYRSEKTCTHRVMVLAAEGEGGRPIGLTEAIGPESEDSSGFECKLYVDGIAIGGDNKCGKVPDAEDHGLYVKWESAGYARWGAPNAASEAKGIRFLASVGAIPDPNLPAIRRKKRVLER